VCVILLTITSTTAPVVVVTAVGVIGVWVLGMAAAYYAGVRRHVARHLGRGWHQGEVVRYRVRPASVSTSRSLSMSCVLLGSDSQP
jgi:hypothetical protein